MKKEILLFLSVVLTITLNAQQTFTNGSGDGKFENDDNWSSWMPDANDAAIFDGNTTPDDCIITTDVEAHHLELGVGGVPYGTLTIKDGGSFTAMQPDHWCAVGWTTGGTLTVEAGGTATFPSHLWLTFNDGASSYLNIAGTVNVGMMFGFNFESKNAVNSDIEGKIIIENGGVLNLAQLHDTKSFNHDNVLIDIKNDGKITVVGDRQAPLIAAKDAGKIIASGGAGGVLIEYDLDTDETTVTSSLKGQLSLEERSTLSFEVYPNPTSDLLRINSDTPVKNVKIFNFIGQQVREENDKSDINISNLQDGLYLVKVEDVEGNQGIKRIMKK